MPTVRPSEPIFRRRSRKTSVAPVAKTGRSRASVRAPLRPRRWIVAGPDGSGKSSAGFEIRLIYVFLDSAERQIERIRLRVAKGGHPVPDDKVRDRRQRSFDQLVWFFRNSDFARVYDNSGTAPKLVAQRDGVIGILSDEMIPELRARFYPELA